MRPLVDDKYVIDKWGYAILAGVIGMAAASTPGGLSMNAGFALGFFSVFLSLIVLEVLAQRVRLKRQQDAAEKQTKSNPQQMNQRQAEAPTTPPLTIRRMD